MSVDPEAVLRGARAVRHALDVVDAAASAATPDRGLQQARARVEEFDVDEARAALVMLAVDAVWRMPLPPQRVESGDQIWSRQQELRQWVWARRRDVMRARAQAKKRLERTGPN